MLYFIRILSVWPAILGSLYLLGSCALGEVAQPNRSADTSPTPSVSISPPIIVTPPVASPSAGPVVPNAPAPPGRWVYQQELTPFENKIALCFLGIIVGVPLLCACGEQVYLWRMRRYRPELWNKRIDARIASYQDSIREFEAQKV
jgi:hypothetical protein